MAGENAGTVYAEIRVKLDQLQNDIGKVHNLFHNMGKNVDKSTKETEKSISSMGKGVNKSLEEMSKTGINKMASMMQGMQKAIIALPIIGLITAIIASVKKLATAVIDWIKDTSQAYVKQQEELAKLNALVNSTGATAWTNTRRLQEQAKELSNATGTALNDVMALQSVLLRFGEITGEIFERSSQVALDLAAAMGTDASNAAQTLGMALSDPEQGITRLRRAGVFLSTAQQNLIKSLEATGQRAEAQRVIIAALEETYGGLAETIDNVSEQSRLEIATERLRVAQGEATNAISQWWFKIRAEWTEARAEAIELRNATRRAENADYSDHIAQIQRLAERYARTREELERINEIMRSGGEVAGSDVIRSQLDAEMAAMAVVNERNAAFVDRRRNELNTAIADAERYAFRMYDLYRLTASEALSIDIDGMREMAEIEESMGNYQRRNMIRAIEEYRELNTILEARRDTLNAVLETERNYLAHTENRSNEISIEEARLSQLDDLEARLAEINTIRTNSDAETLRALGEEARLRGELWITEEQSVQQRLSAIQAQGQAYNQLLTAAIAAREAMGEVETPATLEIDNWITTLQSNFNGLANEYNNLLSQMETTTTFTREDINEFIDGIQESLRLARRAIQDDFERETANAGNEEERIAAHERYLQRLLQIDKQAMDALDNFAQQNGVMWSENAEEWNRIVDIYDRVSERLAEIADENQAAAEVRWFEDYSHRIRVAQATQARDTEALIELERQRALNQLRNSDIYINASTEVREEMEEQLRLLMDLNRQDPIKKWFESAKEHGPQLIELMSTIMEGYTDGIRRQVEEQLRIEQEAHRKKLELIEAEKQARLYAMGFVEAATEEQHQRELELAIESGDQQRIFKAHSDHEKFKIEEEFREQTEAAEKEYQNRKLQLEHQVAMAQWRMQLTNAVAQAAMAVLNVMATTGLFGVALAKALGAAQIAIVAANQPKLQAFRSGGIVAGNNYSGDNVLARVNSGEMVLNKQQQQNMFDMINAGGGGRTETINLNIPITLDGKVITTVVVKNINDRQELIKQGSIVR